MKKYIITITTTYEAVVEAENEAEAIEKGDLDFNDFDSKYNWEICPDTITAKEVED